MTSYGQYIKDSIDEVLYDTTKENIVKMLLTIESNIRDTSDVEIDEIAQSCYDVWYKEQNS